MKHNVFEKIMNLPNLIFERLEWKNNDFNNLDEHLIECANYFREEISKNLFGLSLLEKSDLIKNYFFSISEIYHNYLSVIFEEEELGIVIKVTNEEDKVVEELEIVDVVEDEIKLVKIFKEFFQEIIDIICLECIKYNIDALSIVNENLLSNSILNLKVVYEAKKNSFLDSSMGETNLKKSFTSTQAFDFFNYLNQEFYKNKSILTKYSCIYTKMKGDKFLDNDIKPEHFKQLLSKPPYRINFTHPLKSPHATPKKASKEYEDKKLHFFSLEKL